MEEMAEGALRSIVGVIRWIFWEIIVQLVLFNIGRFALILISLGRYPKKYHAENDETKIYVTGVGVLCLMWLAIAVYNNLPG